MNSLRVVVVGCGNMGSSHARAYARLKECALAGLVDRSLEKGKQLSVELGGVPLYSSFDEACDALKPDAVAVCTYPETHYELVLKALRSGMHVFVEKPLAMTVEEAEGIVQCAEQTRRKVVVGYILRHHPAWQRFIEEARTLGKPLIMRMNLNQQSSGATWEVHKKLMESMSPIVDCGVHYVDVMCQMTRSRPVRVHAIGARVTEEVAETMYNYGHLQVVFDDGSVGWYEAGWGPMMSQTAYFVKDVIGPKGSVSIAEPHAQREGESADIDSHTKTSGLLKHDARSGKDITIDTSDEPDHQELCYREQEFFLRAIRDDIDLHDHLADAVNSLRIVLAADQSVRTSSIVHLP
jgi:predicted dehydrogenase